MKLQCKRYVHHDVNVSLMACRTQQSVEHHLLVFYCFLHLVGISYDLGAFEVGRVKDHQDSLYLF